MKVHLTKPEYEGIAACDYTRSANRQLTTKIEEVTCRICLKLITPESPLEDLRKKALDHN